MKRLWTKLKCAEGWNRLKLSELRKKLFLTMVNQWKVRPLVFVAIAVVFVDAILMNCVVKYPKLWCEEGKIVSVTGKVKSKTFNASGNLSSITVNDTLIYPGDVFSEENEPAIGNKVKVTGLIYSFKGPMNLGEFDKKAYYGNRKQFFYMDALKCVVRDSSYDLFKEKLCQLRRSLCSKVMRYCLLEGGTVNTLLLGDKSNLSQERRDLYSGAGVAHFLVISGLHITAIGAFIYKLLRRLGLKCAVASGFALSFLIAYGILIGFSVSVLRAIVMYFVRILADVLKEAYDMLNAVALAAIVVTLIYPRMVTDSSYIYSFTTVISIAVYEEFLKPKRKKKGFAAAIRERFFLPGFIFMVILPVNLLISYQSNVLSVLVNVILGVFSAPILLLAFGALLGSAMEWQVFAGACDLYLSGLLVIIDTLCKLVREIPFAELWGKPRAWQVMGYVVIVFITIVMLTIRRKNHVPISFPKYFLSFLIAIVVLSNNPFFPNTVSMLYVGQGECIVIRTGMHSAIMVDCGSSSQDDIARYTVLPFLKASGIKKIDALFMTHSDSDHSNGIQWLLENGDSSCLRIENLCLQKLPDSMKAKAFVDIEKAAKEGKVAVNFLRQESYVNLNSWKLQCLWPEPIHYLNDTNGDSMVILASCGSFDFLLTGDITEQAEWYLSPIVRKLPSVDVLKVAHHGSYSATSESFLDSLKPGAAIISAGINNRYGHPHKTVLERLEARHIPYFVTAENGEIDIEVKRRSFKVEVYNR